MVNTLTPKLKLASGVIRVPISDGKIDLVELVKQHHETFLKIVGTQGIYLGIFYDLKPDKDSFNPSKANIGSGRYNLPLDVIAGEDGLQILVADADTQPVSQFLEERGKQEQRLEGAVRKYATAILYQAE
ncbi:MAG: hypothetical protein AABX34_05995 [Nanoarchaeota archaeon]